MRGGWAWRGYRYGHVKLVPGSDTSIKHVDLDESILPNESVSNHFSGSDCKNLDNDEGVKCQESGCGCGVKIWGLTLKTFTTAVQKPGAWYVAFNLKRDQQKEQVYLSLVAFPSSGDYKVLLHRDGEGEGVPAKQGGEADKEKQGGEGDKEKQGGEGDKEEQGGEGDEEEQVWMVGKEGGKEEA